MVTESVTAVEPATPAAGMSYGARVFLTVLLLSLYVLGHRVPLPFVNTEAFAEAELLRTTNIMVLGITPLFIGFLLVEAFSAMTSSGRRLRAAGPAGRAKLNRAALVVSFVMCALQAWGLGRVLATMTSPSGLPLVTVPGAAFTVTAVATLAAVTAALFFVGNFLSEYGIGNGFSLLSLINIGWALLGAWSPWFEGDAGAFAASDPRQGVGFLLAGILAALLIRYLQKSEATGTPPFPQGIVPVAWASSLASSSMFLRIFSDDPSSLPWFAGPVVVLIGVPFFSWFTFHLFSSRQRLANNLSEPEEVLDRLAETLFRRLLASTAVLTVGTTALVAWSWALPDTFMASLAFVDLAFVTVVAFDLRDQFLFLRRNGATARLIQLDNVHFSYRLVALLEEKGIDALARAHHHRALLFFFGPLIKIDVLVPRDQLDEAQAVLAELELAREIKVF
jgi:hypothetical protein